LDVDAEDVAFEILYHCWHFFACVILKKMYFMKYTLRTCSKSNLIFAEPGTIIHVKLFKTSCWFQLKKIGSPSKDILKQTPRMDWYWR